MGTPAPRDTAHKWLAFGAIVVVAVGTSVASSAFKHHLEETLPQPEPALVPAPAVTAVDPAPDPERDPDEDAPAAEDPRVVPSGTPRSSMAARPSWSAATDGWAPVHSRADDLFASAAVPSGDLVKAFVMCRGRSTAGLTGINVRAKLGRLPSISEDGPNPGDHAIVTAPLVDLKAGEPVELVVSTREDGGLRELARANVAYAGKLTAFAAEGDLDCMAMTDDELQDQIAVDAGRADSAIARFGGTKLDAAAIAWGYPSKDLHIARRNVRDVAALAGWDDPRVTKRVDAYARAVTTLDAEKPRVFGELRQSAADEVAVGTLTLARASRLTCDPQPSREARCTVSFVVKNDGQAALVWGRDVKIDLADASGPQLALPPEGQREAIVPPHQSQTLTVSTGWRAKPGPAVAQVRVGNAVGVIKVP